MTQFVKFGIVGFSNTVIAYAIYSALVYVNIHYIAANVAAFIVSVLNSFFWNSKYVFKRLPDDDRRKSGVWGALLKSYVSYAFTGLALSNIMLYVFVDLLRVSAYIAPLISLAITVPLNFILNKKWTFK
jgi:putative flippase GtrA